MTTVHLRFTRSVTHEFDLDVELPGDTQLDLDAGLGIEGLSSEGEIALYELLADPSRFPDSATWDSSAADITILRHGTSVPMLGNKELCE